MQRVVIAVVADPDLRLDEDLVAGDARPADTFADLLLVAIGRGGVDVAIPDAQRLRDSIGRFLWRTLKDAESQGGHFHAIVQGLRECGHGRVSFWGVERGPDKRLIAMASLHGWRPSTLNVMASSLGFYEDIAETVLFDYPAKTVCSYR